MMAELLEVFNINISNEKISSLDKFIDHILKQLEAIDIADIDELEVKNEILEDKKLQMQSKLTGC